MFFFTSHGMVMLQPGTFSLLCHWAHLHFQSRVLQSSSFFTQNVERKPSLQPHHRHVGYILGMLAVLRALSLPAQSPSGSFGIPVRSMQALIIRVDTVRSLFAPIISFINLIGLLYVELVKRPAMFEVQVEDTEESESDPCPVERTRLFSSTSLERSPRHCRLFS